MAVCRFMDNTRPPSKPSREGKWGEVEENAFFLSPATTWEHTWDERHKVWPMSQLELGVAALIGKLSRV